MDILLNIFFEKVVQERANDCNRAELANIGPRRRYRTPYYVRSQFELQPKQEPHTETKLDFFLTMMRLVTALFQTGLIVPLPPAPLLS